jgi:uncharacterized membrane protein
MKETKKRSITKAVSYRLGATMATFSLAYLFTGSVEIATSIGVLDFFIKFTIYYLNERIWTFVPWGYSKQAQITTNEQQPSKLEQHAATSHQA